MPSLTKPILSVSLTGDEVKIDVTYTAVFAPLERFLAANGLVFREEIRVVGEDPGVATDMILHLFPLESLPVSPGTGHLPVPRKRSLTVRRASLQEDVGSDNDEISAWVTLTPVGLPSGPITQKSAEQALAG